MQTAKQRRKSVGNRIGFWLNKKKNDKTQEVYFGNGGAFSKELKKKMKVNKESGKPVNEKSTPKTNTKRQVQLLESKVDAKPGTSWINLGRKQK